MLNRIKQALVTIKDLLFNPVVITVIAIDLAMIVFGHLLGLSAIAGIAATISIVFIYFGLKPEVRKTAISLTGKYGVWVDGVLTVLLTVYGFMASVTLGLTAMMIGLNISAFVAICRGIDTHIYNAPTTTEATPTA